MMMIKNIKKGVFVGYLGCSRNISVSDLSFETEGRGWAVPLDDDLFTVSGQGEGHGGPCWVDFEAMM